MRALALDYQRRKPRSSWIGWAVLVAGILAAAVALDAFVSLSRDLGELEYRLSRAARKPGPLVRGAVSEQDRKRYAEEMKLADSVAERLTLPWEDVLKALEAAGTRELAVLALEPDADKGLIRVTAEAKTKAGMLAYVDQLDRDKRIRDVYLLRHQVRSQDPGQPVRFSMQASWRVERREER